MLVPFIPSAVNNLGLCSILVVTFQLLLIRIVETLGKLAIQSSWRRFIGIIEQETTGFRETRYAIGDKVVKFIVLFFVS